MRRRRITRMMRGMECLFEYRRWTRPVGAGVALIAAMVMPGLAPAVSAPPPYMLYFAFDVPLALPGLVLSDDGSKTVYIGTLKGTLGGLPLTSARLEYGPGASKAMGGGTFSLATPAGTIRDGQILMSTDGDRTTLLFFGIYLGTHIEFSIVSDRMQIGGAGVTATGLAPTGFHFHDEYRAEVVKSIASLAPAARDRILSQVDTNPGLVNQYQQKLH